MRLAIVNITAGGLSGGYKRYLQNMLPRLVNYENLESLLCIVPDKIDISSWFNNLPNIKYGYYDNLSLSILLNMPDKKMKKCLKEFSPDLIFIPTDRYIWFNGIPVVNMLRNMEPHLPFLKGDPPHEILKKYIQQKLSLISVRKADQTIAVSQFVKNQLITNFKISVNKVTKVYHGAALFPIANPIKPTSVPIGWENDFIFTCGSIRPARGLEDALEAIYELKNQNINIRLVIAGETVPGMKKYRNRLEQFIKFKDLSDNICWAGVLNDEQLCWCFHKCRIFIMTSRIEACPNIAIEAISNQALAIAADNPPLPEFFSRCSTYYQPGNGKSLANAILDRLSLDKDDRKTLSLCSRKRSTMFSWDMTADQTMGVFLKALNEHKINHGQVSA